VELKTYAKISVRIGTQIIYPNSKF